jgi:hypothetical protein
MVNEETLLARDSQRDEDCQMKERCIILLNSFKNKNFNKNNILNTSNLNIEETVNFVKNDKKFIV